MFWLKVLGIICGLQISFAAGLSVSLLQKSMPKESIELTCKVNGFYPKAIDVQWFKGETQPVPAKSGQLLLNDDNTYKISKVVYVSNTDYEEADYYCHVSHSSLPRKLIVPLNKKGKK
ncbi:zinc-alpha-2-glycoprotein-like isoform X1 [Polypterus senegalus]|uniref:zinc-alpha-2-glycoprotein-like isoform X1 n=1 Tax=Polypterus senegalus TaxID=55291 RepID=UPI001964B98C|nr:zinc-alpha-2-glycoprotein-like isoform X1 [Polypterus senegalus]